jgi:hypothetical protein
LPTEDKGHKFELCRVLEADAPAGLLESEEFVAQSLSVMTRSSFRPELRAEGALL